ncbi:type II toxin-antitoxin system HipA family toxin [Microbacterium sp. PI-1]|uniref:type II toxin-antitoxin system HipA family toxin n=1 Tax=unclassified Microbacterium TaxID=2609290 RepID=UPI0010393E32|nr:MULTISPECIES: type II toxin-antitoxin system HipA family toxin [unclassified Microbacterium]TCJ23794.1 type II toxin-antitoxin system HipA family toxin [Microbacterium sp. PI-1]UUE20065.1 type II toxin-antitoxin system HipA family toxin [Microbacterium sp. J1-1]
MTDALDVWLDGRFAGKLMRGEQDLVEFLYDDQYRGDAEATPLSASMPKSVLGHGPDVVMPWLSNLLPDAEEVRSRWAAKFGERRTDPFTLLAHMGEDAPGSVQIVPEDVVPAEAGELSEMTERDIARRVRDILADPEHWVDDRDDDASRFSLGGNQGKFALARIDGKWFEPNGRAPSTHIVKPGMVLATGHTDDHVQAVEFVTMRAARAMGVRTAKVELLEFDGIRAFVTTRYDRQVREDGSVRRFHQEDFCQALSVLPSRKYEQDGGPTMADMEALVSRESSPAYWVRDGVALTQLFVFNLLTAGVDAHAKNHSLLHVSGSTRLAPAYDLISAHGLWPEDRVWFKSAAAVKYGKERPYRQISGRNLARAADVLGVPRGMFFAMLKEMAEQVPDAFESAIAETPGEMVTDLLRAMPGRIDRFASEFVIRMSDADIGLKALPRFVGSHAIGQLDIGRTWIPGSWQNGRWVTGRYRSR